MDENGFWLSSPDPLGNSSSNLQYSSPTKRKCEQYTPKKPLADTNGNVRLQDFYLNTPSAFISETSSPTKTTAKAENLISPWRIRVVVEAEREDGKENSHQSSIPLTKQLNQRTTTTIVPLKHAHEPSPAPAKRGRGRPRKSLDSPIKRTGTPKPRKTGRRRSQGDSVGEHSEMDASIGVTPPRRGRGRPRKSVDTNFDDLWVASGNPIDGDQTLAASHLGDLLTRETTTKRKSRGRRKAMTPVKSTASQDSSSQVEEVNGSDHGSDLQQDVPFSRQKHTKPQQFQSHSSPPVSPANHQGTKEVTVPNSMIDEHALPDELHNSNTKMDPTDEHEEFDSILESEGFSMVSISSVPSAQQHLSSPVESERSVQLEASEKRSGIMQGNQAGNLRTNIPSEGQSSSSRKLRNPLLQQLSAPEQSSILSHMASSPPILNPRFQTEAFRERQTPSLIPSSPSLPPPQQSAPLSFSPRSLDKPTDGTPKLARVVRTGIALQRVLSPATAGGSSGSPVQRGFSSSSSAKSPKERLDDLFSGFSAGTRRELRAGLRLGEELAKNQAGRRISPRQEPTQAANSFSTAAEDMDVFVEDASLGYPSLPTPDEKEEYALSLPGSRQIEYPTIPSEQLLSSARSAVADMDDRMSWKADTPVKSVLSPPKPTEDAVSPEMSRMFHEDTMILDWKAEWQREREAVSKQIQSASESQVIVIHSDDSEVTADADQFEVTDEEEVRDEEEAEEDIWQAEAHSSDPALEATPELSEVLFQEEVVKPRRSKLPSPWRRNSEVVYSDEVLQDESDLFWQPNKRPQSNRARQKQEPSNMSVLSEYVSRDRSQRLTPKKPTPAPSPAMEQEPPTYEVEEESFVEEVADEETVLEASQISDEASQTSEPSEASGHSMTEASISQPASSPPPTQPIPLRPQPKSWFSRLTSLTLAPIRLASRASTYLLPASNAPSLHPSLPSHPPPLPIQPLDPRPLARPRRPLPGQQSPPRTLCLRLPRPRAVVAGYRGGG
ncbi:MAG: hypothetical protein FRX48_01284 [Lasallia pustulata]|uniref:Uncharacterized protein n=1 Tax=Lasallia pustulata TaxID=136370 RepID=A0A5M8PZI7_9LECA|nr:MAG: hypothetical protein FRX48_01284 [Lasallia pustulata]